MKKTNLNIKKLGAITIGTLILFSAVGVVKAQNNLPVNPNGANIVSNSHAVATMAANQNNQARVGIAPAGNIAPTQGITPVNPVNAGVGMPVVPNNHNNVNGNVTSPVVPQGVQPLVPNQVQPNQPNINPNTNNSLILNALPMNDPSKMGSASTANINVNSGSPIAQAPGGFDMTPLLQEYARKSALLKIKQLNKDIEKLDKPDTVQQNTPLDPSKTAMPGTTVLPSLPVATPTPVKATVSDEDEGPQVKVFSIYGFDGQLMAKVGTGARGGYVVSKGDILPNGRVVKDISANYITVSKGKNGKGGTEKIFPTPTDDVATTSTGMNNNNTAMNPNNFAANAPIAIPPRLNVTSTPLTVKLGK
jgi:type IV pilus biogenesis protein PilP